MIFEKCKNLYIIFLNRIKTNLVDARERIRNSIITFQKALIDTWNFFVNFFFVIRISPALILFFYFILWINDGIEKTVFDFETSLGLLLRFFFIVAFGYISLYPIKTFLFFIRCFKMLVLKYTLKYTLLYILLFIISIGFFASFCYLIDKNKFYFFAQIAHLFLPEFLFQDDSCCLKNFFKTLLYPNGTNIFIFIIFSLFINIYLIIFLLKFVVKLLRILIVSSFSFVYPNFDNIKNDFILNKRKYFVLSLIFCFKKILILFYGIYFLNYSLMFLYAIKVIFYAFLSDFLIGRIFYYFSMKNKDKPIGYIFFDNYGLDFIVKLFFLIFFTSIYIWCTPKNLELFCYVIDYRPEESILEAFILEFIPDYEEILAEILSESEEISPNENTSIIEKIRKNKP